MAPAFIADNNIMMKTRAIAVNDLCAFMMNYIQMFFYLQR